MKIIEDPNGGSVYLDLKKRWPMEISPEIHKVCGTKVQEESQRHDQWDQHVS